MRRLLSVLALCAGLSCVLTVQARVTFTELSGEIVLTSELNVAATNFQAVGNATLKLSGEATGGVFDLKPGFYIPEGTSVALDVSDVTGLETVRMTGGLRGTGAFTLGSGVTKLVFGACSDQSNILNLPAFEADVGFAGGSGTVVFTNGVSLFHWPADYSIAVQTIVAPFAEGLFDVDALTLDSWDLLLAHTNSVKAGCTITVPAGRTLYHRPASMLAATSGSASSVSSWSGLQNVTQEVNVVLSGGALVSQTRTYNCCVRGDITGAGDVKLTGNGSVFFEGRLAFAGESGNHYGASSADARLGFVAAAGSDLSGVTYTLGKENFGRLVLDPQGGDLAFGTLLRGSGTWYAGVDIRGSGTVTFGAVSGPFSFGGEGQGATAVLPAGVTPVALRPGVTLAFSSAATDTRIVLQDGPTGVWSVKNAADEGVLPVRFSADEPVEAVLLAGAVKVRGTVPATRLEIAAGADVRAAVPKDGTVVNHGGTLTTIPSWQAKAGLWFDASDASTCYKAQQHIADLKSSETANSAAVWEWFDCRTDYRDYRIRATKYDTSFGTYNEGVFPRLLTDSDDGGPYMSWWDKGRTRTPLAGPTYKNGATTNFPCRCVIAVFGSQLGGGNAMLTTTDGRLKRTTETYGKTYLASWPICLDTTVDVRTNGVAVTGSEVGFDGGWQIVTLETDTPFTVKGIGHPEQKDSGSGNAGQNYRELLAFEESLTADERAAVERYLADKWHQTVAGETPAAETLKVNGTGGTVRLADDTVLGTNGLYRGTVDLNGNRLEIGEVNLPYFDAEVPADGRRLWVDARLADAIVFSDDPDKPTEVKMIYTRDNAGRLTANGSYYLTSPIMDDGTGNRRVRFVNGWLVFDDGPTGDTKGNLLLMRKLPFKQMTAYTESAESFSLKQGTALFALDTVNGGGSYVTSAANGTSLTFRRRTSANLPICPRYDETTVDGWLDGEPVSVTNDCFNRRPETLSLNFYAGAGKTATLKCFGYCNPTEDYTNPEVMGEWLVYDRTLSDVERRRLEAYLALKWQNALLPAFSETRVTTVTGGGVLAVADPAALPARDAGFTGSVELTRESYAFTLPAQGNEATDAIRLDGTMTLRGNVTVDLDARLAKAGTYLLMSADDFAAGTTFALGNVTDRRQREILLAVRDNALYAEVRANGLLMLVR